MKLAGTLLEELLVVLSTQVRCESFDQPDFTFWNIQYTKNANLFVAHAV